MKENNPTDYFQLLYRVHVQMKTKTKLFAAVKISEGDAKPNLQFPIFVLVCQCALPVLNEKAIYLGNYGCVCS